MKAVLMLEDGKAFPGEILNGPGQEKVGELLLNTSIVGYQEILTDPANAGKIIVFTYPLIGNYGVSEKFSESNSVWAAATVCRERSRIRSNWQTRASFDDFINESNLLTLNGTDTRGLAVYLRKKGRMFGIISPNGGEAKELLKKIEAHRKTPFPGFLSEVSVSRVTALGKPKPKQKRLAVLDLGMTRSIRKQLERMGLHLTLFPFNSTAQDILEIKPHGLIISSGPEQDPQAQQVCQNLLSLVGKIPMLGISSGLHVLAGCLGAKIVKMKLGHHGANYPVHNPASYKAEITSQNHSFAVDPDSLSRIKDIRITAYNLNDRTVEEIESKKLRFIGIQYEPKSPGLEEVNPVFLRFFKMLKRSG